MYSTVFHSKNFDVSNFSIRNIFLFSVQCARRRPLVPVNVVHLGRMYFTVSVNKKIAGAVSWRVVTVLQVENVCVREGASVR